MKPLFELGDISAKGYFLGIAGVLGLLFVFIQPDDVNNNTFFMDVVHWQLQTVGPMLFLLAAHYLLDRNFRYLRAKPWLMLTISGVAGSLLFSPIATALDVYFSDEAIIGSIAWEIVDEFFAISPPIIICWLAINAPWIKGYRIGHQDSFKQAILNNNNRSDNGTDVDGAHVDNNATIDSLDAARQKEQLESNIASDITSRIETTQLMQLIPPAIKGEIVSLKAELHYISVTTNTGQALILYNLKDAIDELHQCQYLGIQCHRSYWVSQKHISNIRKQARQGVLMLSNGDEVPISRRLFKEVEAYVENNKPSPV